MEHKAKFTAALAGAGTGKTYSLVENYVSALFGLDGSGIKKRPQEILALTFTEKAAHEMRLRVIKELTSLLHENSENYLAIQKRALIDNLLVPTHDEIKRILRSLPNAPIATFHGFCSGFLRTFAEGSFRDFLIIDQKAELAHARNVLRPIVLAQLSQGNSALKRIIARFRLSNGHLSLGFLDSLLQLYFKLPERGLFVSQIVENT